MLRQQRAELLALLSAVPVLSSGSGSIRGGGSVFLPEELVEELNSVSCSERETLLVHAMVGGVRLCVCVCAYACAFVRDCSACLCVRACVRACVRLRVRANP